MKYLNYVIIIVMILLFLMVGILVFAGDENDAVMVRIGTVLAGISMAVLIGHYCLSD